MRELKPFNSERIYWAVEQVEREAGDIDDLHLDDNLFYLKSEADAEIRRLQRALYIARAERALEKIAWFKLQNASISTMNPEDGTKQEYDKWKKALGKFLAKAERYR
jgi:hypothetical protein